MEKKQISETIRTAQEKLNGEIRFYAWIKLSHLRKSRLVVSTVSEADALDQAKAYEEKETARKVARKADQAASRRAQGELDREAAKACKVGQIFSETWGYEQTNVDFYQVVAVVGLSATLRAVDAQTTETGFMSGNSTPRQGVLKGEPFKKRIQSYRGQPSFAGGHRGTITLWDGKPCRVSWYA